MKRRTAASVVPHHNNNNNNNDGGGGGGGGSGFESSIEQGRSSTNMSSSSIMTTISSSMSSSSSSALTMRGGGFFRGRIQQQNQQHSQQQQPPIIDTKTAGSIIQQEDENKNDLWNYALLIVLYTLQGIPIGLSASIPFLIQQKAKLIAEAAAAAAATSSTATGVSGSTAATVAATAAAASKLSYNANAIFAMCSWPFSLKLLWAPIVDACYTRTFGRRKSWLVPVQTCAGLLMVFGANYVEEQLGLDHVGGEMNASDTINAKAVTGFFFILYFLMATQDVAVDGWALTMLSKKNRGRGPVCNSVGQNIGYFLSFVGFIALNDAESSERFWRPLLKLPSRPNKGLVSLGGFIRFMGFFLLITTTVVAFLKREMPPTTTATTSTSTKSSTTSSGFDASAGTEALLSNDRLDNTRRKKNDDDNTSNTKKNGGSTMIAVSVGDNNNNSVDDSNSMSDDHDLDDDDDKELDASEIGLKETYSRLWSVANLPSVRWLFIFLLTFRLPTTLNDNVKFLKAVELGLSKSTTALLSPTIVLPMGILVPIAAAKFWTIHPLKQFMIAYQIRVTIVPILDVIMLCTLHLHKDQQVLLWLTLIASTAAHAIVSSLQFNAQMMFFASRVDPRIGGSYMTLLNTAANLGGTWPAPLIMYILGQLTDTTTTTMSDNDATTASSGVGSVVGFLQRDPYFGLQLVSCILGWLWIGVFGSRVEYIASLPESAWRTHHHHHLPTSKNKKKNDDSSSDNTLSAYD